MLCMCMPADIVVCRPRPATITSLLQAPLIGMPGATPCNAKRIGSITLEEDWRLTEKQAFKTAVSNLDRRTVNTAYFTCGKVRGFVPGPLNDGRMPDILTLIPDSQVLLVAFPDR